MKKIIRLTESDLARIVKRVIQEGNIEKSSKEKDLDVKMENFRDKIRDFLKSKDCKVKQVGTDFEIHCDGEHVGQVMFRRDKITIKKEGSKFGKDFKFNEMGDIKSELTRIVKRTINEMEDEDFMRGADKNWDNHKEDDFSDLDNTMYDGLEDEEWTDYDEKMEHLEILIGQARDFLENECGYDLHDINLMSEDDIAEALFDEGNIELAQEIDNLLDYFGGFDWGLEKDF
jgi:hypothetical protein